MVARGEEAGEWWPSSVGVSLRCGGPSSTSATTRAVSSPPQSSAGIMF
jgi:hypothetical protein